jgi:hypothetical protein
MKFVSTENQLVSATKLHMNNYANKTVCATNTDDGAILYQCISTFKPNYVKVTLLKDTADCHSKAGGGAIGIHCLNYGVTIS